MMEAAGPSPRKAADSGTPFGTRAGLSISDAVRA